LDLINILKRHKQQYGVSADPQIDTLINQLNTRARNYIRATHNLGSPIAFDLNNDGKIGTRAAGSSNFDLNADGIKDQTSWLDSNDGFLVLDRNGNGTIDDGRELFGDQHGADNGFKELAKFDENGDGVIDNKDSVFSKLKVWVDSNGDGVSQANELKTLAEWGINSVDLAYSTDGRFIDENDVDHREIGSFTINGQKRLAVDVWFALGQG
jgi:hypothetical protein